MEKDSGVRIILTRKCLWGLFKLRQVISLEPWPASPSGGLLTNQDSFIWVVPSSRQAQMRSKAVSPVFIRLAHQLLAILTVHILYVLEGNAVNSQYLSAIWSSFYTKIQELGVQCVVWTVLLFFSCLVLNIFYIDPICWLFVSTRTNVCPWMSSIFAIESPKVPCIPAPVRSVCGAEGGEQRAVHQTLGCLHHLSIVQFSCVLLCALSSAFCLFLFRTVNLAAFMLRCVFFHSLYEGLQLCMEDFQVRVLSILQLKKQNKKKNDEEDKSPGWRQRLNKASFSTNIDNFQVKPESWWTGVLQQAQNGIFFSVWALVSVQSRFQTCFYFRNAQIFIELWRLSDEQILISCMWLALALWKNCRKQPRGSCLECEATSRMNCMTTAWWATWVIRASFCKKTNIKAP